MLYTLKAATLDALQQIDEEKRVRQTTELFLLFGLGSQFDHLIKQALEKLGVFCLVADPATVTAEDVRKINPVGIILSGGPVSVHANPPPFDEKIFDIGIPVLGICLGFQMWTRHLGISVSPADRHEYSTHTLIVSNPDLLFTDVPASTPVLESHGDRIENSAKLTVLASTENAPVAAARFKHLWGVQFHLEVTETTHGAQVLENFCFGICGAKDRYPAESKAKQKIAELKEQIGSKKVLLALSGGSDSSVTACLLEHAMADHSPDNLRAVYIRGIDRPDDEAHVRQYFSHQPWIDVIFIDATDRFLEVVQECTSMHAKRLAMRGVYKDVLEEEARKFGASFIAQGTLYTDICESGGGYDTGAVKAQIKLHHNVDLKFFLPELTPLADCVKPGARQIGREIGVPEDLLIRHPFPGPGLLIRIEGQVDKERLAIARKVDSIYIEGLREWKLYNTVWQAGAVVTQSVVTCTKGDAAATGIVIRLWAVWSIDGFTAQAAEFPWDFIKTVIRRIHSEVPQVGSVDYRISDKPPATIECG